MQALYYLHHSRRRRSCARHAAAAAAWGVKLARPLMGRSDQTRGLQRCRTTGRESTAGTTEDRGATMRTVYTKLSDMYC